MAYLQWFAFQSAQTGVESPWVETADPHLLGTTRKISVEIERSTGGERQTNRQIERQMYMLGDKKDLKTEKQTDEL